MMETSAANLRSAEERRSTDDRRSTDGTGPGGVERRHIDDRRGGIADRRSQNNLHLATFYANGEFFGIRVERVQEIILAQERTPVPKSDRIIRGLVNLRGQIVTAIDLRRVLGLPDLDDDQDHVNLILNFADGVDSLQVDEIGDVMEVSEQKIEPPPPSMTGIDKRFVEGVCKLDGKLLLILDVDRLTGRVD
ncbi:MAG: chemotaxis protein CheW [Candidatus Omnitrophica bacterium]|nr:chemotaxis protein CheW [Candidatus Omnitrophota bacterium]